MGRYSPEQARALELSLMERVRALPGVDATAIAARGLMRGIGLKSTIVLPGQKVDPADNMNVSINIVSPEYFSTMGMHVVAGRNHTGSEPRGASPTPEVVNQAFARRFFPGLDPVGRLFGEDDAGGTLSREAGGEIIPVKSLAALALAQDRKSVV